MKHKKKKKDDGPVVTFDLELRTIACCSTDLCAVFYDPEDEDYCYFPVILFGAGKLIELHDGAPQMNHGGVVRGLISNHGGLELVEDNDELEFIGYWRRDLQLKIEDFFQDHGIDEVPGAGTAEPTFPESDEDDATVHADEGEDA